MAKANGEQLQERKNNHEKIQEQLPLPEWFGKGCLAPDLKKDDKAALVGFLSDYRRDMLTALTLYQTHVRYVTWVVLSLIAVPIAFLSPVLIRGARNETIALVESLVGGTLLLATLVVAMSFYIVMRYHNFYVAMLIGAAEEHHAVENLSFYWFERVLTQLKQAHEENRQITKEQFIYWRTFSNKDSHFWYSWMLFTLGIISGAMGMTLLVLHPFSWG